MHTKLYLRTLRVLAHASALAAHVIHHRTHPKCPTPSQCLIHPSNKPLELLRADAQALIVDLINDTPS